MTKFTTTSLCTASLPTLFIRSQGSEFLLFLAFRGRGLDCGLQNLSTFLEKDCIFVLENSNFQKRQSRDERTQNNGFSVQTSKTQKVDYQLKKINHAQFGGGPKVT